MKTGLIDIEQIADVLQSFIKFDQIKHAMLFQKRVVLTMVFRTYT